LALLEGLAQSGLSFVFKGGTALMLLLEQTKRLSIDIDIIIPQKTSGLEELLQLVVQRTAFVRLET
jgi:predicted nucleotidyltransferase component of viral defense system